MIREILLVIGAYLLGSIPTGLILAKSRGVDIRSVGSGNIGATNVTRNMGKTLGAVTLLGDLLKGLIPVLIGQKLGLGPAWLAGAAVAAFMGHVFPLYLGFKGGKGVATAFGVVLGLHGYAALIAAGGWLAAFLIWRYASVGSLTAAVLFPIAMGLLHTDRYLVTACLLIAFVIYIRHRENIRKLLDGTEGKYGSKAPVAGPGSSAD